MVNNGLKLLVGFCHEFVLNGAAKVQKKGKALPMKSREILYAERMNAASRKKHAP